MSFNEDEAGNIITHPFTRGPYYGPGIFNMNEEKEQSSLGKRDTKKSTKTTKTKKTKNVNPPKKTKTKKTKNVNPPETKISKAIRCKGTRGGTVCYQEKNSPAQACSYTDCTKYRIVPNAKRRSTSPAPSMRCAKVDKNGNLCGKIKNYRREKCECGGTSKYKLIQNRKKSLNIRPTDDSAPPSVNLKDQFDFNPFTAKLKNNTKRKKQKKRKSKKKKTTKKRKN